MNERKNKIEILRRIREGEDPSAVYELLDGMKVREVWVSKDGVTYETNTGLVNNVEGLRKRIANLRRVVDFTIMTLVPAQNDFGRNCKNVSLVL